MIVKLILTNGSCQTFRSTIESLANIPQANEHNEIYLGRSKEGFSEILRYLRGEIPTDSITSCNHHIEDFIIHGLYEPSNTTIDRNMVEINVGGTIFSARECVLKTMKYFESLINNWGGITAIGSFIDRNPEDFATFLHLVETQYHEIQCGELQIPSQALSQALFFGHEFKKQKTNGDGDDEYDYVKRYTHMPINATDDDNNVGIFGLVAYGPQNAHTHSTDLRKSIFLQQYKKSQTSSSFQFNTLLMTKGREGDVESIVFKVTIPRTCDLIGNTYLCIDFGLYPLTDLMTFDVGFSVFEMIKKIQLKIGSDVIDSYSGDAMRVFVNNSQYKIEKHESRMYIPMSFFYQNNPHLFIPKVSILSPDVCISVFLNSNSNIHAPAMAMYVMYKAIFVDTNERQHFATQMIERDIYVTMEQKYSDITVHSNESNKTKLVLKRSLFKHIAKDIFIYLKPKFKMKDIHEPLNKIELQFNKGKNSLEFDPILTRKIIPREIYGIDENKELIYYIPLNNSFNFSRFEHLCIKLTFAIQGSYDIIVISKMHNVLRIMENRAGLAFSNVL